MMFQELDERQAQQKMVDAFAKAMMSRLDNKRERKSGWDDFSKCTTESLRQSLLKNAGGSDAESLIDAANYAAFLWNRTG